MSYVSGCEAPPTEEPEARRRLRLRNLRNAAALLALCAGHAAAAAGSPADRPLVSQALAAIARTGIRLIYSSQVVPPWLRARSTVRGKTPEERLHSLLAPLGLVARPLAAGGYVIIPAPARAATQTVEPPREPTLAQVVVQTSRYQTSILSSETATRAALESSPETHNDAVRALQVIPGTTAAGYTARTHVRGSRDDEVLFRYDGVTLHEPYHLKELQSLFSPVDPTAVASVTSWTGIAPIEYGGEIGGVVDMRPRRITRATATVQISEQGASAMAGRRFGGGRGSVFADLRLQNQYAPVGWIDSGIGKPTLNDLIVHGTWNVGERTHLAAGALAIDDHRKYFSTENAESKGVDGGEYYAWFRLDHRLAAGPSLMTLLSAEQSHENVSGSVNEPNIVSGRLFEHSWHSMYSLRAELRASPAAREFWHAGIEATWIGLVDQSSGYATFAQPFYPGLQPSAAAVANEAVAAHGITYALYGSVRWQAGRSTTLDIGVRRDARRYRGGPGDSQWSVRANVRERLTARTILRFGWGQESQAEILDPHQQGSLVVPQSVRRLSQTDLSLDHRFADRSTYRAELYYKDEGSPYGSSTYIFSPFALLPELAVDSMHVYSLRSRMYGAELSLMSDRSRALSGTLSYVWSRAEDLIGAVWIPRPWDEPNALKLNALWRHGAFSAAGSLTWHSGWPHTPLQVSSASWTDPATVSIGPGPLDGARLGSFFTLDARLAWERHLASGTLQTFLNIYDLTGAASVCCRSYTVSQSPGGVYTLTQSRSPWLNFTPVLGIRWHF